MGTRLPAKLWLDEVEDSCMSQIMDLTSLPFAFKHIALMPDCHSGYGMPIGGVLAVQNVVVPNAVGVDIGCGMCAIQTTLKVADIEGETLHQIREHIKADIPVGHKHHTEAQESRWIPELPELLINKKNSVIYGQWEQSHFQVGTLGGGNHFIEIQSDTDDNVWVMIHSGSRNVGKRVCDHWNDKAKKLNTKWFSLVPNEWDLAYLPIHTDEAKDYLAEMNWCLEFAYNNRLHMMETVKDILRSRTGCGFFDLINIHHNYAAWENHFGENVLVHRKGATRAREGEIGIIPGSQGSNSYIVRGLGNRDSFMSCSHGAGRRMGRKEAQRSLDLDAEIRRLDEQGILHGITSVNDLDEATSAYKDIESVMALQTDLVEPIVTLRALAVVKAKEEPKGKRKR